MGIEDGDGEFLGDCGLTWQTLDGETELEVGARACRDFARARGVERLIAITAPENRPSQRVAEKIGMRWERSSSKGGVAVVVHAMSL